MDQSANRRRLIRARDTKWAAAIARWLARVGLRPNQISVLSVVCAALAGACLVLTLRVGLVGNVLLWIGGAAFVQLRLLCNLFDGMVAVEGGLQSKSGEIYNELPDRISDALILVSAGYATVWVGWERELGWAGAVLAVITAYVRTLGTQAGASPQFCGPMAKQQRMFVVTLACVPSAVETILTWPHRVMTVALLIVIAGCGITIARRSIRIVRELESK